MCRKITIAEYNAEKGVDTEQNRKNQEGKRKKMMMGQKSRDSWVSASLARHAWRQIKKSKVLNPIYDRDKINPIASEIEFLMDERLSRSEIARRMGLSLPHVGYYYSRIMKKKERK